MDPIFKKCLIAIEKINTDLLPKMKQSYGSMMKNMQLEIQGNQGLNQSRQFAKAAIEAENSGLIDNKNIKMYLSLLRDVDTKLDNSSLYLTDLLEDIKNRFINRSKNISEKNLEYLNEMKNGNTNAQELLQLVVTLGKDVQKVINEEMPAYQQELKSYIKDIENKIVDSAHKAYNEIQKLDSGTLPAIRVREWTYLPGSFFRKSGAFVHTDYTDV